MARNTIKGITVEIGGDTTDLQKSLANIKSSSKSLQSELTQVNRQLKFDPSNAVLLTQKQELLEEQIANTKLELSKLKEVESQIEEQAAKGEIGADKYRAYQREVEIAESKLKTFNAQLEKTKEKSAGTTEALQKTSDTLSNIGDKTEKVGSKLNVLSGIAVGAIGASVAAFEDLDSGYDTIVKKTGSTGDSLNNLKGVANDVYGSMNVDMDDVGSAVGEINTRFGLQGESLKDLSAIYLEFAKINDADVTASIANTSKIMQAWNVDSSQTANLLGIITSKAQSSGISVDTLMSSVLENNSTFKEMGLSLEQSINLMSQFEASGVDSSTALTSLKKAVTNAADEGKTLDEALGETIRKIQNASSETDALQTATELFGTKGAVEMTSAIRDGRFSLDDLSDSMSKYGDTVSDTYNATQDPVDKAKTGLNNLKLAGAELGEEVLEEAEPLLEDIIDGVKGVTSWLKKLTPEQKETLTKAIEIFAILGPGVTIVGKMFSGVGNLVGLLPKAVTALKTAKVATEGATVAQEGMNFALNANPVGVVIGAIGLLTGAMFTLNEVMGDDVKKTSLLTEEQEKLYQAIDKNKESWDELTEKRQESSADITSEYGYYDELFEELQKITDENGNIKSGYEDRADTITSTLASALDIEIEKNGKVITNYKDICSEIKNTIAIEKARAQQSAYLESYNEAITNQTTAWNDYRDAQESAKSTTENLNGLQSELDKVTKEYNRTVQTSTGLKRVHSDQNDEVVKKYEALNSAVNYAKNMQSQANDKVKDAQNTYLGYINTIKNYEGVTSAIASGETTKINTAINNMVNNFISAENGTKTSLEQQVINMETNYQSLKEAVENGAPGVTQTMVDNAAIMVNEAITELDKFKEDAPKISDETAKRFANSLSSENALDIVRTNAKKMKSEALNALKDDDDTAYQLGIWLAEGYAGGIENFSPKATQAAIQMTQDTMVAIRKRQNSNSPSKETAKLGKDNADGYALGIKQNLKNAVSAAKTMAAESIKSINGNGQASLKANIAMVGSSISNATNNGNGGLSSSTVKNITNAPQVFVSFGDVTVNSDDDIDSLAQKVSESIGAVTKNKELAWY